MSKLNFDPVVLTQDLVKCQSITPEDRGALNIVEKHLNHLNFTCNRLNFSSNNSYEVDNLFATQAFLCCQDELYCPGYFFVDYS